jgi:hypothetical protein
MIARDDTGGVAQNAIAALERRGYRLPSVVQALGEEFRRGGLVIPHGDRRDGPQSRGVED